MLILRSSLGTTPISSVNYVLSLNSALTLGTWTFVINMLLIAGQVWFIRDRMTRRDTVEILLQMPFSLLFGLFIDFNMALTQHLLPPNYAAAIVLLLAGCIVQSIGVVLEIKPRVVMMSAEGFVNYASRRYNTDFGKSKVAFDISLVTVATLLSLLLARRIEGVREGTLIAACSTGYIVSFLNRRILTRATPAAYCRSKEYSRRFGERRRKFDISNFIRILSAIGRLSAAGHPEYPTYNKTKPSMQKPYRLFLPVLLFSALPARKPLIRKSRRNRRYKRNRNAP